MEGIVHGMEGIVSSICSALFASVVMPSRAKEVALNAKPFQSLQNIVLANDTDLAGMAEWATGLPP